MTKMLPSKIAAGATASEGEVFRLIRDAKDTDEYVCLHSLGLARHARKEYAEADFVVIGPTGIFCLEVKGGNVKRQDGLWTIGWPGKEYQSVEGPFKQSQSARWSLLEELDGRLRQSTRKIAIIGWGVMFPDVVFTEADPEWDQEIIYDLRDRETSFRSYLDRLHNYFVKRIQATGRTPPPPLSSQRIKEIVACLRGDFDVVTSVKGLIGESNRELISLSSEQYRVLDYALNEGNPRLLCEGVAGSGKTLIALEAARRLAEAGKKVLLLCFNENLAQFLKKSISDDGGAIRAQCVYAFLREIIALGGESDALDAAHKEHSFDALYLEQYPRIFDDAATRLLAQERLPTFDCVVIDEGQDILNAPILNCLSLLIDGGFEKGRWVIFFDPGLQAEVYGRLDENVVSNLKALGPAQFQLRENFRNPKNIITEMCALIRTEPPICRRNTPSNVDYRLYSDDKGQGKKLRALLVELLREGVKPEQITVLSSKERKESCAAKFPPDLGQPITYINDRNGAAAKAVTCSSVSAFKGLENEIIVLTDLPKFDDNNSWSQSILYVGMTRATTKLYALVHEAEFETWTRGRASNAR